MAYLRHLDKRSLLLNTQMRFSPSLQPPRENALDKIVENLFFVSDVYEGMDLKDVQEYFSVASGGYSINIYDLEKSVKRLVQGSRLLKTSSERNIKYRLYPDVKKELNDLRISAENNINTILLKLLRNTNEEASKYEEPFLKALSNIFSRIGEESARLIKGDALVDLSASHKLLTNECEVVSKEFRNINKAILEKIVSNFFNEKDPVFDTVKWHMAQNYYVVKAIGIDPSGTILSKELFENVHFFLDTNVVVAALESSHLKHNSFLAFTDICRKFRITLSVSQITLFEFDGVVTWQKDAIRKVADEQIPVELEGKIRSDFYEMYLKHKKQFGSVDLDALFEKFMDPKKELADKYGVNLDDDEWYVKARDYVEVNRFAEVIRKKYEALRGRPKTRSAAIHDAVMLFRIKELRDNEGRNVLFLTTDRSLAGTVPYGVRYKNLSINLTAVLQWMSPLADVGLEGQDFPYVFSELVKRRILPQERFFDLEDFLVFHDLHMACKELPAADVEDCILYLKKNVAGLDPSTPEDREKIAYEVSKFFADPGRKHKLEVSRLEKAIEQQKSEYENRENDLRKKMEDITKKYEEENKVKGTEYQQFVKESGVQIEEMKKRLEFAVEELRAAKKESDFEKLRRDGITRLIFVVGFLIVYEIIMYFVIDKYIDESNMYKRVFSSIDAIMVGPILSVLIGWIVIGRERLKALGWPFDRLFSAD